jgi:hypothetical protein
MRGNTESKIFVARKLLHIHKWEKVYFSDDVVNQPRSIWRSSHGVNVEIKVQILAHPVCKMWITQEPKKLALQNTQHFEEKEGEIEPV